MYSVVMKDILLFFLIMSIITGLLGVFWITLVLAAVMFVVWLRA